MGRAESAAIDKILANSSRLLIAVAAWFIVDYVGEIKAAIASLTQRTGSLEIAQARTDEKLQVFASVPKALADIQKTLAQTRQDD